MAVLHSLLPHLGLFLCLALYFSPAFSASNNDSCVIFDKVSASDNLEISTKANVSDGNTTYTVKVPVSDSVSAIILKAVKQNNDSVGTWSGDFEKCNDTSVYRLTSSGSSEFKTTLQLPNSEDVTKINLQVFVVVNRTAAMVSVRLNQSTPVILTPTPPTISETSQTTAKTTAKTTAMTTAMTTAKTIAKTIAKTTAKTTAKTIDKTTANGTAMTTANATAMTTVKTTPMVTGNATVKTTAKTTPMATTKSLAINILASPLTGALHILLVFLISKLLF